MVSPGLSRMIFFLLLVISSLVHASLIKRKATEVGHSEDTITTFKKAKLSNDQALIFVLPEEVLAYIGTFLENPFKTLTPVSVNFRTAIHKYTPQYLLQSRSFYPNLNQVPCSKELKQLLEMDPVFLNSKFDQLVSPGSIFVPLSPIMVEYAVSVIAFSFGTHKDIYLKKLINMLKIHQQYQSIIKVLHLVPDFVLNFFVGKELIHLVAEAYKQSPEIVLRLGRSISDIYEFIGIVASFPVSSELFFELLGTEPWQAESLLNALASSCSLTPPIPRSSVDLEFIRTRNAQIIDCFELSSPSHVFAHYAHLCNNLRYSTHIDSTTFDVKVFLGSLKSRVQAISSAEALVRGLMKKFQSTLIMATVLGNHQEIFPKLLDQMHKCSRGSKDLLLLLKESPEFLKLIKLATLKELFGITDQVFFLDQGILKISEVSSIANIYEQVKVYAKLLQPSPFINKLLSLYGARKYSVSGLIKIVAKDCGNPAKIIDHILTAFKDKCFTSQEQILLAQSLGEPKYLKSLLSPENSMIVTLPSPNYLIIVDANNFEDILALASELKTDQARDLRNRFLIKWMNIFMTLHVYTSQIVEFFSIFGLSIGNFDISAETMNQSDSKLGISTILNDSTTLFKNTTTLEHLIDSFLVHLAHSLYHKDVNLNLRFMGDRGNSLLMKSFGLYALWQERNILSFIKYAPKAVLNAFSPKVDTVLLKSVIFNYYNDSELCTRIFDLVSNFDLVLKNVHDLRVFFYDSLPKILALISSHQTQTSCRLMIEWNQIFENSNTPIDYEIILSIIKPSELEIFLNCAHESLSANTLNFIGYYYHTLGTGRDFPQFNRII